MIVPAVTKENPTEMIREGVILNLGYVPPEIKNPRRNIYRYDSYNYYKILGVVTRNEDLGKNTLFKTGDAVDEQRFWLTNLDLKKIAKHSNFVNSENMDGALIELIDPGYTDMVATDPAIYNVDASAAAQSPYQKVSIFCLCSYLGACVGVW